MNKKSIKISTGFTLPEVIVSIGIITLVVFSSTNLLVSIIRSNKENADRVVAYGLAQESMEAIRNIRDSNWLLGADFSGNIDNSDTPIGVWGANLPTQDQLNQKEYYVVSRNATPSQANHTDSLPVEAGSLISYLPWNFNSISNVTGSNDLDKENSVLADSKTDVCLNNDGIYVQVNDCSSKPLFKRYVVLDLLQTGILDIQSVVKWNEYGTDKEVRLHTQLTNWK